jgi:adenine-specific DNA-methyltransferase
MAKREVSVEALRHKDKRRNIPTAELEPVMDDKDKSPIRLAYERRNRDLDPQLVWRGKDEQDWSDLIVQAPPLYIQEKVHPKVLIDDLLRQSKAWRDEAAPPMPDLFADFNGLPDREAVTEFYQHDANWSNRMILGDSLAVMASLAEREGLRGKMQCIYIDPPYGIRFNSNFQWSTTSRDVKDGNKDHITREPEQVRAFRDTWRDGIHSYLTYLRDRLTVARDLLADSGSIFVQIGDENVHRVRTLMDEVFGEDNLIAEVSIEKTSTQTQDYLPPVTDYLLWFAKGRPSLKYRPMWKERSADQAGFTEYSRVELSSLLRRRLTADELHDPAILAVDGRIYRQDNLTSQSIGREKGEGAASWFPVSIDGSEFRPSIQNRWKTNEQGMGRLVKARRVEPRGSSLSYVRFFNDFGVIPVNNIWRDVKFSSRSEDKSYIVQTAARMVERCILMTTDPGDLVLDPTCGSGTTAYVAEQWGRRWITIDTSRVALALARARIMGARYPYYLLADSREGQRKEGEVSRAPPKETPTHNDIRQGFVYERVPHITLKSIANNAEIDVIWEKWQQTLEPLRARLNAALRQAQDKLLGRDASFETAASRLPQDDETRNTNTELPHAEEPAQRASRSTHGGSAAAGESRAWEEWEIPREAGFDWPEEAKRLHADWWQARIARQKEIDASIAAKAEFEYLYDKPYSNNSRIRVAGPLTVESLSPHRYVPGDLDDSLEHELAEPPTPPSSVIPGSSPGRRGLGRGRISGRWCSKTSKPPGYSRRTRKTASPSPP